MSRFARRLEAAPADTPKVRFQPWHFGIPHLDSIVSGVRPGFVNMIFARPHVGKRLHEETPVLTPTGWVPIKGLTIGDRVIGRDGKAYNVSGVFREDDRPLYRITFSDGVTIDADDEHIWTVKDSQRRARGWHEHTTAEMVEMGVTSTGGKRRFSIPLVDAVEDFAPQELNDDPYLLGVVLGDGSSTSSSDSGLRWQVCTDVETLDAIGAIRTRAHKSSEYTGYGVVRTNDLEAGRSWEKVVPTQYLYGSREQRLALLQGLLDTDGHPMKNGGIEFCSTSENLVDAVVFLVQSFGGLCMSRRVAASTYTHNGEKRTGRRAERVFLKLPADVPPFRLQRKLERWVPPTKFPPVRTIKSIERIENGPGVCISVDSPDHLYVVKDFIVTHNTLLALAGIRSNPQTPTLFLSADDEPDLVVRKMMFFDGLVDSIESAWGITPAQMQAYIEANYPNLDIRDDVTWGPSAFNGEKSVADAVERFTEEFDGRPPELIVYDYLGIDGTDYAQTMQISAWQKALAKKMPMPILIIGQSNRQKVAQTEKQPDGSFQRRGFRMEDMSYGGEQQAGLILGLTKSLRSINGRVQDVIEVDVVKNKAVFDGSGLTKPSEPVVLCHSNGRLTDMWTAERESLALEAFRREEANRAFSEHG